MSFANWKKRSKKYKDALQAGSFNARDKEELAQAAYKAGEREGIKAAENAAKRAIVIREWLQRERSKGNY